MERVLTPVTATQDRGLLVVGFVAVLVTLHVARWITGLDGFLDPLSLLVWVGLLGVCGVSAAAALWFFDRPRASVVIRGVGWLLLLAPLGMAGLGAVAVVFGTTTAASNLEVLVWFLGTALTMFALGRISRLRGTR